LFGHGRLGGDGFLNRRSLRLSRSRCFGLEFGRTEGVDVAAELGAAYLDMWINKIVRKAKR